MCVDCVLASPRIAQVDPVDEPLPDVVLSQSKSLLLGFHFFGSKNTLKSPNKHTLTFL
jgi:hypothetical protein